MIGELCGLWHGSPTTDTILPESDAGPVLLPQLPPAYSSATAPAPQTAASGSAVPAPPADIDIREQGSH